MRRIGFASAVFVFLGALQLGSQTTSTAILGTVTDPTGAVVTGAKVTLLQVQTGIKRTEATSSTGDYTFPLLDPGEYTVTVEAKGFKTETVRDIKLELNLRARIDVHLQVGAEVQTVKVSTSAALLSTDQATLGQVVDTRPIEELPMAGRNLGAVAVLQPGIQYGGRMGLTNVNGASGGVPVPGDSITLSANGQRDTDFHATLDGVSATEARVNTLPFTPSPEAVLEFKVLAGTYSAEYGTHSGAQLTIALKSGTNQYHGDAFEFLRNDKLDAEDFFQSKITSLHPARRWFRKTSCGRTNTAASSAVRCRSRKFIAARIERSSCSTTRRTKFGSPTRRELPMYLRQPFCRAI